MNFYHLIRLKLPGRLILLAGIGLVVALCWGNGSQLSWAAPDQNPQLQTVPPRPEETPEISPTPTQVGQPTKPARPEEDGASESDDDDDDDEDGDDNDNDSNEEEESGQPQSRPTGAAAPGGAAPSAPAAPAQPGSQTPSQSQPSSQGSSQKNKSNVVPPSPQQADLSLLKLVNNPDPEVGEIITFTVTVSNSGPSRVTNVIVKDQLPPGLVLSATFGGQGSYEAGKGHWIINTIGQNRVVTMNLVAKVAESLSTTVTAEVVAVDQFDPDSTPNNQLEGEDDQMSVTFISPEEAALAAQRASNPIDLRATPLPTRETLALSPNIDWLYWLGAIIVGIIFVFIGIQLVHRS